ncbi:septum formation initiator family protein [Patescibacteria group bacterium]
MKTSKIRQKKAGGRSNFMNVVTSRLTLIIGLVLIVVIGFGLIKEIDRRINISQEKTDLETQIAALQGRNTELTDIIDYLQSDEYAEEEARLKLGLKKPGENVLRIVGVENTDDIEKVNNNNQGDNNKDITNPIKWWNYFINN